MTPLRALLPALLLAPLALPGCGGTNPVSLDFVVKADVVGHDYAVGGVPVSIWFTDEQVRAVDSSGNVLVRLGVRAQADFVPHAGDACLDLDTTTHPPWLRQAVLLADGADDGALAHDGATGLPRATVVVCRAP